MTAEVETTPFFPYEIQLALDGLCNENRRNILSILIKYGELSFSELENVLNITGPLLSSHLKILIKNLLVEQFYEHSVEKKRYSFYKISNFGKNIIEALNKVMNPMLAESFRYIKLSLEILEGVDSSSIDRYENILEGVERKQDVVTSSSEPTPKLNYKKISTILGD